MTEEETGVDTPSNGFLTPEIKALFTAASGERLTGTGNLLMAMGLEVLRRPMSKDGLLRTVAEARQCIMNAAKTDDQKESAEMAALLARLRDDAEGASVSTLQ